MALRSSFLLTGAGMVSHLPSYFRPTEDANKGSNGLRITSEGADTFSESDFLLGLLGHCQGQGLENEDHS